MHAEKECIAKNKTSRSLVGKMKPTPEDLRQRLLPIFLSQAVGLVCGIIGVRLTSRLVDPADYGTYGVFVSLVPIGSGVIYIGLVKFVSRHWHGASDRPGLLRAILADSLRKMPWLLAACAIAAAVVSPKQPAIFGALLFACAFLLTLTYLLQAALQADRDHWRDFGVSASLSMTRSFLPPLLYFTTGAGLRALLFGFLGQAFVGVLIGAWNIRRWWRRPASTPGRAPLDSQYSGYRFAAIALAGWIVLGLNRWLVASFYGAESAGYFTLAGNIGVILPSMLGLVLLQFLQPLWFAHGHDSLAERRALLRTVDRAALFFTALAVSLIAGLQAAMPHLIGPLVSTRYEPAVGFVLATGLFATGLTVATFYHTMLLAAKRETACTAADLGGAACLMSGCLISAMAGLEWFKGWLMLTPLVPWLVNRSLARRALLA